MAAAKAGAPKPARFWDSDEGGLSQKGASFSKKCSALWGGGLGRGLRIGWGGKGAEEMVVGSKAQTRPARAAYVLNNA